MSSLRVSCLALAAVGTTPLAAQRPVAFPDGLYGNVSYGEESGDLGGFEVRFYVEARTGRRMAEFTLCEGWCNEAFTAEVTREGESFVFSHVETLVTYDGDRVVGREEHQVRYRVTRAGAALRVHQTFDGQDMTGARPWRIRPLRKPYGLAVARREQDARRP
jgi:hypothetical protein